MDGRSDIAMFQIFDLSNSDWAECNEVEGSPWVFIILFAEFELNSNLWDPSAELKVTAGDFEKLIP